MEYALITGAEGGLGRAFTEVLMRRGIACLCAGLDQHALEHHCTEMQQTYGLPCLAFVVDLRDETAIKAWCTHVNAHYRVFLLINNAGLGGTSAFEGVDSEYLLDRMKLNVMAPVLLTRLLLPNLMRCKQGYVLNVSSMIAFSPVGFKTVYPATKVFLYYFSRGMYAEFARRNVLVSVVHPGPMPTQPEITARIAKQGWMGRMACLSPEVVAERSIARLFKGDALIMLNVQSGLQWLLMKTIPMWIRLPLMTRLVRRELKV
jgi:hypothetical protein